jgi:oxygen-independent coproporphyrinogen-3 oxidase
MNHPDRAMSTSPALFVYIPYCRSICTYCDFNVYARRENEFDAYANAVAREIEITAQMIETPRLATSLAFGGGTPSILSAKQIAIIVNAARAQFEFDANAEWTLEANPGTVDLEKMRALREMGFNRVSLGVQTFDDARLKQFNRAHTVADIYDAFAWARRVGFENLNLDLIYGLPNQSPDDWRITLERALAFESEHLSLYGLQIEERTVLKKQMDLGRVPLPDDELAAQMYEVAVEMLARAGFVHYEISNWAKPGFESQHNKAYWLNDPYLGFGAGAHSSWQHERYENVRAPLEYIKRLARGDLPVAAREKRSRAAEISETMFLGLRLAEGIVWTRFSERFGEDARDIFREPIALLQDWKMLEVNEERMRLTEQGMLVSNQLLWRFLLDEK